MTFCSPLNMQDYLRTTLILRRDNPLFDKWGKALRERFAVDDNGDHVAPGDDGKLYYLPVIPDMSYDGNGAIAVTPTEDAALANRRVRPGGSEGAGRAQAGGRSGGFAKTGTPGIFQRVGRPADRTGVEQLPRRQDRRGNVRGDGPGQIIAAPELAPDENTFASAPTGVDNKPHLLFCRL